MFAPLFDLLFYLLLKKRSLSDVLQNGVCQQRVLLISIKYVQSFSGNKELKKISPRIIEIIFWIQYWKNRAMKKYIPHNMIFCSTVIPCFLFYVLLRSVRQKLFSSFCIIEAITLLSEEIAVGYIIWDVHKMLLGSLYTFYKCRNHFLFIAFTRGVCISLRIETQKIFCYFKKLFSTNVVEIIWIFSMWRKCISYISRNYSLLFQCY